MELGDRSTKDEGGRRSRSGSGDDDRQQRPDSDGSDDEGTRQPYNCTFCKRGFPTAQALGGHMNIHRKDRGRASTTVGELSLLNAERPVALPPLELRLFEYGQVHGAADRGKEQGGARDRWKYYVTKDGERHGEEELDLELRLGSAAGQ